LPAERSVNRLGRTVSEARSTLPTPHASRRPMLKIPWWREIIKLPNPMIVDNEEKTTACPVLLGRGKGVRDLLRSSW